MAGFVAVVRTCSRLGHGLGFESEDLIVVNIYEILRLVGTAHEVEPAYLTQSIGTVS